MMNRNTTDYAKSMFDVLDMGLPWPPRRSVNKREVDPQTGLQPLAAPSSNRKGDALAKALRRRARSA